MSYIHVKTGKELLELRDLHEKTLWFHVVNGVWTGKLSIKNNKPFITCYAYHGEEVVNAFQINNNTPIDLIIEIIHKEDNDMHENESLDELREELEALIIKSDKLREEIESTNTRIQDLRARFDARKAQHEAKNANAGK